jgi:hypothetical protein
MTDVVASSHRVPLKLSREQILGFRRQVGSLQERLPPGVGSLRRAAWCGLQDSMPRAALLSVHARVQHVGPQTWEHSSFAQLWGPRYSVYVVARRDIAVFSLGRLPQDAVGLQRARETAARLQSHLGGRTLRLGQAGHALRVNPNSLRYAATMGTLLIRWEGAHDPDIRMTAPPRMSPLQARLELARRYLSTLGPATPGSFGEWAGMRGEQADATFAALRRELLPVRTPLGAAWILAEDEQTVRKPRRGGAAARLLPSGDAYYLLWGADRTLLLPDARQRAALWTTRVWPGAILVNGEIVGVWRRAGGKVSLQLWQRLSAPQRRAVQTEALLLPLPGLGGPIEVSWN